MQATGAGRVNRLRSIAIGVTDVERSLDFYTRVWGLQPVHRSGGVALLRAAGEDHHVLALHEGEPLGARPRCP